MSFFLLCFSSCPFDARFSFSSSFTSFLPLLLLPHMVLFSKSHLISSCCRSTHIISQSIKFSLPKILLTNTFHSSETLFRENCANYVGWSVNSTANNWSLTSRSLLRKGSIHSPLYKLENLTFSSKYIFHYSEDPWYSIARASHICLAVSLPTMCDTMWSWTPIRSIFWGLKWAF